MYEANNAPDKDMPADEFVERLESSEENINHESPFINKDTESELGLDNTEAIDDAFEELPEDLYGIDEDGNMKSYQEMDDDYILEMEEVEDIIGCLNVEI